MQYSSLPAEVEAAGHVVRRRCAVDWPPTCLKAWTACCMKVSMLSTGVAWTGGWAEDVEDEAACTEGFWSGAFGSALPALQSLARCSSEPQFKHFLNRSALDNSFMECWLLHLDSKPTPLGRKEILACVAVPSTLASTFGSTSLSRFIPGSIGGLQCKIA